MTFTDCRVKNLGEEQAHIQSHTCEFLQCQLTNRLYLELKSRLQAVNAAHNILWQPMAIKAPSLGHKLFRTSDLTFQPGVVCAGRICVSALHIHGCTSHGLFNTLLPRLSASMPLSPTYSATWFALLSKNCSFLSHYNPARGRLRWLDLGFSSAHSRTHCLFKHYLFNTLRPRFSTSLPFCSIPEWRELSST